ncbi:hypothetical protein FOA43_004365 [Brettanomyces nanus]|uniref:1,3-beta-glucanosyltransferase n=1 Tax=Eeniella nana TaxID=13502 RepID=A0A875S5S7_EENNA|nr:uncharacterized protein FOA43_004365 [Brettanomyces nanus]QPG76971.1 hypothetical protein FOA43_004365 [Brettanomyces nanus]
MFAVEILSGHFPVTKDVDLIADRYIIDLGEVSNEWDIDMYANFTAIIDKSTSVINLIGFAIEVNLFPYSVKSLPFIKAAVRDMKQYVISKRKSPVFVGLNFFTAEGLKKAWGDFEEYMVCDDNPFKPDFYMSNETIIPAYPGEPLECSSLENSPDIEGIEPHYIPHTPTTDRCNCILSAIYCFVNPEGELNLEEDNSILKSICQQVDCRSIENRPESGDYGLFAGCSKLQKHSIAFNLFYTYHKCDPDSCDWNGHAKLKHSNHSAYAFQDLQMCKEEIPGDWKEFLIGVEKSTVANSTKTLQVKENSYQTSQSHVSQDSAEASKVSLAIFLISLLSMIYIY